MGFWIDEELILFPNITYIQKRSTSSKSHGLESACIIHVKASTIFRLVYILKNPLHFRTNLLF